MSNQAVRGQIWHKGEPVDGFELEKVSDCIDDPDRLVWADLINPTHDTMTRLAEELSLNKWAVEDALAASERVKATAYAKHTFVTVYAVAFDAPTATTGDEAVDAAAARIRFERISLFIVHNALITVRLTEGGGDRGDSEYSDVFDMDEVLRRWDEIGGQDYGVGALLHGLLDVVVDGHFDTVQQLDDAIEDLEELLFDEKVASRALQRRTYSLRKNLVALRRVVLPMREVVSLIQRKRHELGHGDTLEPEFTDLYDHVLRVTEWTESLRDMVTTVFETNLSLQDARLNTVMKQLTAWAAIIAVPTAITGFYGQNVPFPGFEHTGGFITSVSLLVVSMTVLYLLFKRRDWL
ncbi:magnesium transporter CorA family protein [Williamsia phyllosphaerae]|uniref:Magnesium transporter n=1 Tax=Williamsia phyllosphaerae TaxID=885042 RepID=A0ABQ1UHH0_9NOCA|nr:magnesium transporter CorA family protein [Williamsia phyllosphaerae]GGF18970.1 magnesium transporter [Williamsia phyllosphaerae]